tara:strand:+ start:58 stop:168 length:111 start_codon:yes stop_codon:yes gene_type:complete
MLEILGVLASHLQGIILGAIFVEICHDESEKMGSSE